MEIIILGAGQVGASLAENLTLANHNVTLVDSQEERLKKLQDRFEIRPIVGPCSHPDTLLKAGAEQTDTLIAVTDNDEANMIACQVAHTLFKIPTKIARIRSQGYLAYDQLFGDDKLPIDVFFSPEFLVTQQMRHLIEHPGTLQVIDLMNIHFKLIVLRLHQDSQLKEKPLNQLNIHFSQIQVNCIAIFRNNEWITIHSNTILKSQDLLYIIAAQDDISKITKLLGYPKEFNKNIMIAGGGRLGFSLTQLIKDKHSIKIIEHNMQRCEYLSQHLNNIIILQGDIYDKRLLINENIEDMDVFCAVSNNDADNVIASLQAKELGAKQVITLLTRPSYINLINSGTLNIDIAISPQNLITDSIMAHLQKDEVINIQSLRQNEGEIIEIYVAPHLKTKKIMGATLEFIHFKKGINLISIIRNNELLPYSKNTVLHAGDYLILLADQKSYVSEAINLFT